MKRFPASAVAACLMILIGLVLAVSAGAAGGTEGASFGGPQGAEYDDGTILVAFDSGTPAAEQDRIEADIQGERLKRTAAGTHVLRVARGKVAEKIEKLKTHAAVRYAEPNYILRADTVPTDSRFSELWGLRNTGQAVNGSVGSPGADVEAEPAWNVTTGSDQIVVGVVDTGIDYNHPDLAGNVWSNPGGIGGCPQGSHGFNAITNACDPLDDNNHGSHVSGTIGAVSNNGAGVTGVSWNVKLMGLKFLGANGSGTTADAIQAIDFAVNAKQQGVNVRILSNSWGGGGFSQALLDAINRANANDILFVAAAGNSGLNNNTTPHYPSSYNASNVVSVAATTSTDGLASFSNYGSTSVHLGAPGVNILSTTRNNTYSFFNGTSMATPHVSGAAALVLSAGYLGVANLKSRLLSSVDPVASLSGKTTTGGRLNVCKAIPGCAAPGPSPDFTVSASPSSQSVTQGSNASYTVNINRTGGHTSAVNLSSSVAGATFSPNPAGGSTSTLTVPTGSLTPGSYTVTISGTDGTVTRTTSVSLTVNAPTVGDFSLSASPTSRSIRRNRSTTYTVTITRTGGFTGAVSLSLSGQGSGTTSSFSPNPATAGSSTLTVTTSGNAARGTFTLTIRGTSGALTRTTNVTLTITRF